MSCKSQYLPYSTIGLLNSDCTRAYNLNLVKKLSPRKVTDYGLSAFENQGMNSCNPKDCTK